MQATFSLTNLMTARQGADRARGRAQRGKERRTSPVRQRASTQPQQAQQQLQQGHSFTGDLLRQTSHHSQQQEAPCRAAPAAPPGKLLSRTAADSGLPWCGCPILALRHSYKRRCNAADVDASQQTCSKPASFTMQHSNRHRASATGQPASRVQIQTV